MLIQLVEEPSVDKYIVYLNVETIVVPLKVNINEE